MLTATIDVVVFGTTYVGCVFETCSAIGTSGMSTGVTEALNSLSRIVIIV